MDMHAFEKYVRQMSDIRKLSSPQLIWTDRSETYSARLKGNFKRIGEIAGRNREILDTIVFPLTDSEAPLDPSTKKAMEKFCSELVEADSLEKLDVAIMSLVSDRLMRDARKWGGPDDLIHQLDNRLLKSILYLYMTSRIFVNDSLSREFRRQGLAAAVEISSYLFPEQLAALSDETKKTVLDNERDYTLMFGSVAGINADDAHEWVEALDHAMSVYESPVYRELCPDYDWDYAIFRTLDHYGVILDYMDYVEPYEADARRIVEQLTRQEAMCQQDPEHWRKYTLPDFVALSREFARYRAGDIPVEDYRKWLLTIYERRNRQSYDYDNLYINIKSAFHYILTLDPDNLTERERSQLHRFYRGILGYAFRMPNSGTLGDLLEFITPLIRYFIEVPGDISLEDMGLQLLAALHPPTYVHSLTVAHISRRLCGHLVRFRPSLFIGILDCTTEEEVLASAERLEEYTWHAALCHDFGKIPLIDTIFVYGRKLMDSEFNVIRQHPDLGAAFMERCASTKDFADVARGHHRWYNNKGGYPADFDTSKSPVKTIIDIVTVADCLDAATDTIGRSYNKGKTLEDFIKELEEGSGTRYAPFMAELFGEPEVREDLAWLLEYGRQNNYRSTYLLLRGVQEREEASRAGGNAKGEKGMANNNTTYINVRTLRKGEVVFSEGDESDCMFEVLAGQVGIYKNYGTKEEELITTLDVESIFGEMGMVEGVPRSATVVAMENDTEVARITWPILGNYFKTRPSHVVQIMQQTSDRLRKTTRQHTEAVTLLHHVQDIAEGSGDLGEIRKVLRDYFRENG